MGTELGTPAEPARQSRSKVVAIVVVQAVCVAFVAHTLWNNRSELGQMPRVGVVEVLLLLALNGIGHVQRTVEFTYMLRKLGVRERFADGFLLTGAGFLLNHLPFNAGFVMRAVVLRRDHDLPYSSYVSLTMVNAVVNLGVGALLGLIGVSLGARTSPVSPLVSASLAAVVVSSVLLLYLPASRLPGGNSFVLRQLRKLAEGVAMIRGNGAAVGVMAILATSKVLSLSLRFAICFALLGQSMPLIGVVLVAIVQNLMAIVNVTPGNLGLREIVVSIMAAQLGTSQTIGLAAASVDRVFSLAYAVIVGLPGLQSLRNRGRRATASA
jgi:uncharacterized membrane protein YbhN (UPF0104 family)